MAELIRIAASTAIGSDASGPVKNKSVSTSSTAATRPVTWLLPPTASFTAVRESAPLTANPCSAPAPMSAMPSAMNSWFGSMSYRFFTAKPRAVTIALLKLINARPMAP